VKVRAYRETAAAPGERGFALIAILALAALMSAYLIATVLNPTGAGLANAREERSMNALRQAKAALIAYAASEQWQLYKSQVTDQPGALPCPDINHDGTESDEGNSDCVGLGISSTKNLIGRIPWKTLGTDDLRDASGERLWYALSFNFRKLSGTTVINSDTQACDTPACNAGESQLTVTGTAPASNVVAIVFAPGQVLDLRQIGGPLQNRPADHTDPAYKDPINYLENFDLDNFGLGDGRHYRFTTNAIPDDTLNDRLLVITQAELMAAVEPVVAARIERDVKPRIQDYFTKWGAYPFAVPFAAPPAAQSNYKGVSSPPQTNGLLPITNASGWVAWKTSPLSSISVTQPSPPLGGTGSISSVDCSGSNASQIYCRIDYGSSGSDRPVIHLQATSLTAAMSFANPVASGDATTTMHDGTTPTTWTTGPTVTNTAQADGNGTVIITGGQLQSVSFNNGRVFITVPAPSYHAITNSADPTSGWFVANQWYRQIYYAVSAGYAPAGGSACNPLPSPPLPPTPPYLCLKVNNLPPSYATANDKRAILVLAGRALNGNPRPSGTPADYLENANLAAALGTTPYVYEHRAGVPTSINDRVVVVSP